MLKNNEYDKLVNLRHYLHKYPELSGKEYYTSDKLIKFIKKYHPDNLIRNLGGNGFAAVYGNKVESTVMFRADLDALPIEEKVDISFKSAKDGVSHLCGHDGHMATLAGLSILLNKYKIKNGRVVLLFQPSEETGQGAKRVLEDPKFKKIAPDLLYAYHNIPGFKKNKVILKRGYFSSASSGMSLKLKGVSSHAAYPEKGISPVSSLSKLAKRFKKLNSFKQNNYKFITIVGVNIGGKAFGTSPGNGTVHATLRAKKNKEFEKLKSEVVRIIEKVSYEENIEIDISFREKFKAVKNSDRAFKILTEGLKGRSIKTVQNSDSFRWSEDFGEYSLKYDSCLFGIGIGEKAKNLHNPNYYFPDEIMKTGINVYISILEELKLL